MARVKNILINWIGPFFVIFQLLITVWSIFYPVYWFNYKDSIGYSIAANTQSFILYYFFHNSRYSFIYWSISLALMTMNIVSWLGKIIYYCDEKGAVTNMGKIYDIGIALIAVFLIIFIWIKKRKEEKEYININIK